MKKDQCHHIIFWNTPQSTKPFSQNNIIIYLSMHIYIAVKLNLYKTDLDWKSEALPMEPDDITVLHRHYGDYHQGGDPFNHAYEKQ